jgi:flagellar protein FlaG
MKGNAMSSELTLSLAKQNQSAGLSSAAPAGVTGVAPKVTAIAKAEIMPIPKAEINFDSDRMLQNLRESISKLNEMLVSSSRGLNFSMDEKLGRPIIYVKNSQTGEIVRQIPNEVVVRIAHGIEDLKGLLHNTIS